MGTSQSEPKAPMSSLQKTYYVTKSIEGLLVILATLFILTGQNEVWVPVILGVALILILASFVANERRERNPWLEHSTFLVKKRRSLHQLKAQADSARSPQLKRVVMEGYYLGVRCLIDDLTQFKMVAVSEKSDQMIEEIQSQIDELKEIVREAE